MSRKVKLLGGLVGVFVVMQLVPFGRDHTNPPVKAEPQWTSPEVRALVVRACFDCHSNETVWPWYSNVAPISWMVQEHVDEGREYLNFSEWNRPQEEAGEAGETVAEGEMPIPDYVRLHPQAALTPSEKARLIEGLNATLGAGEAEATGEAGATGEQAEHERGERDDHDDDDD